MTHNEIKKMFREKNDAGKGFAVGLESDNPRKAAERDGYKVIDETCDGIVLAGIKVPGWSPGFTGKIIIANCNGPWAVNVDEGK